MYAPPSQLWHPPSVPPSLPAPRQNKAERRLGEGRPSPSDLIARNLHAGLRLGEPADLDLKVCVGVVVVCVRW